MLGNSIFSTWTGTKLLWKCGNLIVNWVTLSSTNYTVPERLSSQSGKKYEIKKTSKISILQLFRELEKKKLEVQPRLIFKTPIFHLFHHWESLRSPARETFEDPKMVLWIRKNLKVQPNTDTQVSQFWIYV